MPLPDDLALRLGVADLVAAYGDCIDDDRLEEWPEFFVDDCHYLITSRESHEEGLRHGVIYAASKGMLIDRVNWLRRANIFEKHRYRHVTGAPRILKVANGVAEASHQFFCARIMHDGETTLFATGRLTALTSAPRRSASSSARSARQPEDRHAVGDTAVSSLRPALARRPPSPAIGRGAAGQPLARLREREGPIAQRWAG